MPLASVTELVDGDVVADAGNDVLKDAPAGFVEEHVIGDDRRHAHRRREIGQLEEPELIVRPSAQRQRQIGMVAEGVAQPAQTQRAFLVRFIRHKDRDQALAIGDEVRPGEIALALAGALLAEREQPTESRIGRPIGRIDEDGDAVAEVEATADHQADAGGLGGLVGAHDASQRVAIDDGERLDTHRGRGREQLLAGRGAPEEAEMRRHLKLGVARVAHPKIPCRNQRCEPVSGSSPSPARYTQ